MDLDLAILRWVNGLAGQAMVVDTIMRFVVNDYFVPTSMSLLLLALWFSGQTTEQRERNQRGVMYAVLALLLANIVVRLSNLFYYRARPFVDHDVTLLFYKPTDSSFPSQPAAVVFAFAMAIWLHTRHHGWVFFGLAGLFAFARVYCGVHYPSDVLVGGVIGGLAALLVFHFRLVFEPLFRLLLRLGRRVLLA